MKTNAGDPPASLKVAVEVVAEHLAQGALGFFELKVLNAGIDGIDLEGQREGVEDPFRQLVVADPIGARFGDGPPQP